MRIGTFNVLADAYLHYGDSSPSEPELQEPGGRIEPLKKVINSLEADVLVLSKRLMVSSPSRSSGAECGKPFGSKRARASQMAV